MVGAVVSAVVLGIAAATFIVFASSSDDRGWTSSRTAATRANFESACTLGTTRCATVFDCLKAHLSYQDFNESDAALSLGQVTPQFVKAVSECR